MIILSSVLLLATITATAGNREELMAALGRVADSSRAAAPIVHQGRPVAGEVSEGAGPAFGRRGAGGSDPLTGATLPRGGGGVA